MRRLIIYLMIVSFVSLTAACSKKADEKPIDNSVYKSESTKDEQVLEPQTSSGKVLSVQDTGLGPFEGITFEEDNTKSILYFMVEFGKFKDRTPDGNLVGKIVNVKYRTKVLKRITDLMLRSEYENEAAQAHVYIAGTYLHGEIGDMGSYITIKDLDGKEVQYLGNFEIDADNTAKYKGKDVVLYYEEEFEYELLDLTVIK